MFDKIISWFDKIALGVFDMQFGVELEKYQIKNIEKKTSEEVVKLISCRFKKQGSVGYKKGQIAITKLKIIFSCANQLDSTDLKYCSNDNIFYEQHKKRYNFGILKQYYAMLSYKNINYEIIYESKHNKILEFESLLLKAINDNF